MPNMSHCRFENTYYDLLECAEALRNDGVKYLRQNSNKYEKVFIDRLIFLCEEISSEFVNELHDEEE